MDRHLIKPNKNRKPQDNFLYIIYGMVYNIKKKRN